MPKKIGKDKGPARGGFTLRGSWNDEGHPDSPLTNFIRQVRKERATPGITPREFVERIPEAFAQAFPLRDSWASLTCWADCRCYTSAESTVVYAFKSKLGDPRPEPDTYDPDLPLQQTAYMSRVNEVAERINKGCALHGIIHSDDPRRIEVMRLHGELVARGIEDPGEIVRVIAHRLKELAPSPERATCATMQAP